MNDSLQESKRVHTCTLTLKRKHTLLHTNRHTHKQQGTTIWVIKNLLRPEARLAAPASTKGRYLCVCGCVGVCVSHRKKGQLHLDERCHWEEGVFSHSEPGNGRCESESWVLGVWR